MDPHPLAKLFKRSNYEEPIASELSADLLKNHESFATLKYYYENYAPNAYVSDYIKSLFATLEEKDDMHESIDNSYFVDLIKISPLDERDACYSYGHDANINDAYGDELAIVPYVENEIISIEPTLDSSLNEKHDCNDIVINSINCANNMRTPKLGDANFDLGDANFDIFTTYCNDHDWGDNVYYDLENLFMPHDEYAIGNNVCNNIKSGFGRV
jgi:hypothetical protein